MSKLDLVLVSLAAGLVTLWAYVLANELPRSFIKQVADPYADCVHIKNYHKEKLSKPKCVYIPLTTGE